MSAVVQLVPSKQPDEEVVMFLERALEEAKSGELRGVLLLKQDCSGGVGYTVAGLQDRWKILAFLSHAQFRMQTDS